MNGLSAHVIIGIVIASALVLFVFVDMLLCITRDCGVFATIQRVCFNPAGNGNGTDGYSDMGIDKGANMGIITGGTVLMTAGNGSSSDSPDLCGTPRMTPLINTSQNNSQMMNTSRPSYPGGVPAGSFPLPGLAPGGSPAAGETDLDDPNNSLPLLRPSATSRWTQSRQPQFNSSMAENNVYLSPEQMTRMQSATPSSYVPNASSSQYYPTNV